MESSIEKTKVYIADTSCFEDSSLFEEFYSYLPLYRREKVDRMKMQEDKIRGLAAGVLLQKAYLDFCEELAASSLCEFNTAPVSGFEKGCRLPNIITGKNGKPAFENSNIFFNLSHSGKRVMCAMSTGEVGCDVEYKNNNHARIANRFFARDEVDYINSLKGEEYKGFTVIWTLKESLLKASGCGLSFPMNEFSVVDNGRIADKITFSGDGLDYYLINYPGRDEYAFSCASLSGNFTSIHTVDFK